MKARKRNQGFTLVEILIVVVILGILAAIVIPQFTNASETAKASSLISQLQTIRSQLELYQVQHNGDYPDLSTDWTQLTAQTDVTGAAGTDFGPYLQQDPTNAFTTTSTVAQGDPLPGAAAGTEGWVYNNVNGAIKAVLPSGVFAERVDLGLSDADVVTGP